MRELEQINHVGIDEKSFGKGQDYISIMVDIDNKRVLEVQPGRTRESVDNLWKTLSETLRSSIKAVAMDMWQPFMESREDLKTVGAIITVSEVRKKLLNTLAGLRQIPE